MVYLTSTLVRFPSTKVKKSSHSHKQHDIVPRIRPMTLGLFLVDQRSMLTRLNTNLGPDIYRLHQRRISPLYPDTGLQTPSRKTYSDQDQPQHDPDPPYYREVALSDIPCQYAEEVDTFRRILKLPDPRESLPRSSTAEMGLDDEKGRQELRPRGPSSVLSLNSIMTFKQQIYLRVNT